MLRPATDSDLDTMLSWRNQPANRDVSLTQHVITADEHAAWWARVARDPATDVLIFESAGRARGVVMFTDVADTQASWGFYLDHDGAIADGTALLAWMTIMREAVTYAFTPRPDGLGIDALTGEVLGHNEAVRAMNHRLGFVETERETRSVDGQERDVITVERRNPA